MRAPTAKAVARQKYQFYNAMICDGGPSALQLRIAWRLIDRLNTDTGDAWPSYETLADELGVKPRSVIRAIKRLIKTDWFEATPGGGNPSEARRRRRRTALPGCRSDAALYNRRS